MEVASSIKTVKLSSLDHTPLSEQLTPSDQSTAQFADDDSDDGSDDSHYIEMRTAQLGIGMMSLSESQDDLDVLENWGCSEVVLHDNPSYLSMDTLKL